MTEWHLGGALSAPGGGPAGFGLGLVGVSRLRGRRGRRVPSLASLLEVALVPGGLGEHLHPALLVLLQASPELRTLPLSLQLPGEDGRRRGERDEEKRPDEQADDAIMARRQHVYISLPCRAALVVVVQTVQMRNGGKDRTR